MYSPEVPNKWWPHCCDWYYSFSPLPTCVWLILPSRSGMTLFLGPWAWKKSSALLFLDYSRALSLTYRVGGWQSGFRSFLSLSNCLLLKLVLCLGKSRWSCGQLAKLPSKYKGEERKEKPDLPETTESKNGAAWVTTWGHGHRTFPQLSPLLLWRTHSFLPFPLQHRVEFAF